MKKILFAFSSLLLINSNTANAQLAVETFNAGLPSTWTMFKVDNNTVNASAFAAPIPTVLTAQAWMTRLRATGDSAMLTASNFTPPGTADRWLVSPSFSVNNANMILKWEDWESAGVQYNDSIQVWVSTTGGATPAAFTTKIFDGPAAGYNTGYTFHGASLAAFNGQTVKIAIRNHTYNQGSVRVDNVQTAIIPANDLALTAINPTNGSYTAYGLAGSNITLGGTVTNNGAATITSFTVKYQQGANPVVSQTFSAGVNLTPLATYSFTMTTPFTLPATIGAYPIKMWVIATGDAIHTNDTLNTAASTAGFFPAKKILVEEATGTWCGWCPRGAVYTDSVWNTYRNNFSIVAVHNGDPMTVTAYDSWMGSQITGYPSVVIDRREVADPSALISVYNTENNYFGYATMTMGVQTISGTTLTVPVTIKPAVNLVGDYRLVLALTEDGVTGAASGYNQNNYYSSTSQNQPLVGAGHNWQTSPNPIPAAQMQYNFVARGIFPSVTGTAATVNWAYNQNYNFNLTATIDPSWNTSKLRAVVMLIDGSTGTVLNSGNRMSPTSVTNLSAGLEAINVYPNPTSNVANVKFNLTESSNVQIQLIDAVGKVVYSKEQQMNSGAQLVTIPTANMANGLYNVKIQTVKGSETLRLTVLK